MLGEITHLQGIIDDLVVLTAEPHKLPAASEQVRPALGLGTGEGMACPWLGTIEEERDRGPGMSQPLWDIPENLPR